MEALRCQKCRTTLRLDESLHNLNAGAYDMLVGPGEADTEASTIVGVASPDARDESRRIISHTAESPLTKRVMPATRRGISARPAGFPNTSAGDSSAMSFIVLTDSHLNSTLQRTSPEDGGAYLGPEQRTLIAEPPSKYDPETCMRLFDALSSRSDIDHPVCKDCSEVLLTSLQSRLSESIRERDAYAAFFKSLKSHTITESQVVQASKSLEDEKKAEDEAFSDLIRLEAEKGELEQELAGLDAEARALDVEEDQYWQNRNVFEQRLASINETYDALNASLDHDFHQLERLERTNVYNDTFFISHDGPFGTINGLRLGRLSPPNNVDWPEINAAWGTTVLLITTVAERLRFSFDGYVLRPMGSTSRIEKLSPGDSSSANPSTAGNTEGRTKPMSLELFSSGDLPLGKQLLHRRFNEAMVAFLECLRQLCDYIRASNSRAHGASTVTLPPYKIERDKINGVSIKIGVSQDETWTTACKYTLTCCKFLLAHISNTS